MLRHKLCRNRMETTPARVETPGKTLILDSLQLFHRNLAVIQTMYALFAQLTQLRNWNRWTPALRATQPVVAGEDGVASSSWSAPSRVPGSTCARRANCGAASAYLSVVR